MDTAIYQEKLLAFLTASKSPFHAALNLASSLQQSGFTRLDEGDRWQLEAGRKYYVVRGGSSIIAFQYQPENMLENGIRMVGAHTDSPCLVVKPRPSRHQQGYFQLGVEVYGGALLAPWFDRDLSIAGRTVYRNAAGEVKQRYVDFEDPIATVPSLAIHLDRNQNTERSINAQRHMPPVLAILNDDQLDFNQLLQQRFFQPEDEILSYDLYLYDTQPAAVIGLNKEFIASARLDNLLSCFVGLQALQYSDDTNTNMLICTDHEEVGSCSAQGANGPFLADVLQRIVPDPEMRTQVIQRSMMISCDNAHAIHPNFADLHDSNHQPKMNAGPVIKVNANQRYATNSVTNSLFKNWCRENQVPVQEFVTRTDLGCGSTIGPIVAGEIGVQTIDVGIPQLGMHSIRELAGSHDPINLSKVLVSFYNDPKSVQVQQG